VRSLCVAADGARLFSCAGAGGVWVWDASTLALLQKLLPHFAPDSLLLVRAPPLITAAAAAANAANANAAAAAAPGRSGGRDACAAPATAASARSGGGRHRGDWARGTRVMFMDAHVCNETTVVSRVFAVPVDR